jgi:phage shock protein PspC (stress-responsive transcriptional regulator)
VGGGLGRYFGVDPILFRIGFAVAALAGGAGLLAYFALWLLVPDELGQGVKRPEGRTLALIVGGGLLLILLFALIPGPGFFIWPSFFGLVALGLLVAAVVGADRGGDTGSRLLRGALVALAVIAAGVAGVVAAVGTAFGGGAVVAGIVILLGLGLVAGAFGHGRRWLIIPALVLAAPAAIVQASDLRVEGGVGERQYRPTNDADLATPYKLGAGELTIDMTGFDFPRPGHTAIEIDLGLGVVEVIVPDDVCVSWKTDVGGGVVEAFGRENGGLDFDWDQRTPSEGDANELLIDADVDFGAVVIRHPGDPAWDDDEDHMFGPDHDDDMSPVEQAACR